MKRLFLIYFFLLLVGQINVYAIFPFQTNAENLLNQQKPTLSIQANVYFGNEDEETFPIVDTKFYLLDKNLVEILKTAKFKPVFSDGKNHKITDEDYLEATAKAFAVQNFFAPQDDETELITFLINQAISKHQKSVIKTDYTGKGDFKSVKTGNYYLFGIGRTEAEVFVWNLPVEIKSGSNVIELDQHNAQVVYSVDD
jgi:hypothetical protein